ncbi:MAG TPA: translocation/assembly module TamB domain-containing protein [candidate division Zixibacteria bacterium]|nr:translocation/assembly module TamB domain-containing protein [candidate division Zixibacteria bacterium]
MRARILIGALAVVVLIVLGGYIWLFHAGGLEYIVNGQLADLVEGKYNLTIAVDGIGGDIFTGIVLTDIEIRYTGQRRQYPLATIGRLNVDYSLYGLLQGEYDFDYLHLHDVHLNLVQDSSGRWLMPRKISADTTTSQSSESPHFSVNHLLLDSGSVTLDRDGDTLAFDNIYIDLAVLQSDNTFSVDLDRLEFTSSDPRLQLDAAAGKFGYTDQRVVFQDLALISHEMRIKLEGLVDLQKPVTGHVTYAIDNIDLGNVTAYVGPNLHGVLDLNGAISFVGSHLNGFAEIAGDFMIASFENLYADFDFDNNVLTLDTLYGVILGSCGLDGSAEIDFGQKPEQYHLAANVRNFNLKNLLPNSFYSDLSGAIDMHGSSFRNKDMTLEVAVDLFESTFDEYPIQHGRGDILITVDSISFADSFMVAYYENIFYAGGHVDYDSTMQLHIVAELNNLDRYRGKLFLDQPGGRAHAEADLTGVTSDPDLTGRLTSDSLWLYGLYADTCDASVRIDRFLTGKKGEVAVDLARGAAWSVSFDSSFARLRLDSNLVLIDSASLFNPISIAMGRGVLDYEAIPMNLKLDTLTMSLFERQFYSRRPLEIEFDSLGLNFVEANIGNRFSDIKAHGRADYDEQMSLQLEVEHVPIAPWLTLFEKDWPVDGRVSAVTSLTGTLEDPVIELQATIDSLVYQNLVLGELATGARYRNRRLAVDSLVINSQPGEYRADGFMHVDLALTADSLDRFPDLPMDMHITAFDRRFDLVSLVMPNVDEIDGEVHADFRLSGTPLAPELEGYAYITGDRSREDSTQYAARIVYSDIEDPIYIDSAGVTMRNNLIILNNISIFTVDKKKKLEDPYDYAAKLRSGERLKPYPTADINGMITVKSLEDMLYDLRVELPREWPFNYTMDDISGRVEGDLYVEGMNPPKVSGDLTIISMRYEAEFADENQGSPIMLAFSGKDMWDLDLNIDVLSNYWIKNEDIDAEFSGSINLRRDAGVYRLFGELEVLRGTAPLADKTFKLESGGTVTFNGEENFNGTLDITACTYITGYRPTGVSSTTEDETPERLNICVLVSGTIDAPDIAPTTDSDIQLSEEELLPLLLGNSYGSSEYTADSRWQERISGLVGLQLSQIGQRTLNSLGVGVETFEIDPYYMGTGQYDPLQARVTAGGYIRYIPGLYLYGQTSLSLEQDRQAGVEYRISKNVMVTGRTGDDQLYRLGLKLHWEF